jgi:hypothetical protein
MPSDSMPGASAVAVAAAFVDLPAVIAVALAGSETAGAADEQSDLDLYVYAGAPVAMADRVAIAARFATRREIGNHVWEPGDEWIDTQTGRHVDVMYRTPLWIEEQLERVLVRHEASLGYSTCFWHNVLHSTALFDRSGWYRETSRRRQRARTLGRYNAPSSPEITRSCGRRCRRIWPKSSEPCGGETA